MAGTSGSGAAVLGDLGGVGVTSAMAPGRGQDPDDPISRRRSEIADGLRRVRARIDAVSAPGAVDLVAVTKTRPASDVVLAAELGVTDVGENRPAELADKVAGVAGASTPGSGAVDLRWHLIGPLQTNKVNRLAREVPQLELVQTLDRPSLVTALARALPGIRALVQVNLSGEAHRGGVGWDDADGLIEAALAAGIDVRGVMGVAPLADDRRRGSAFARLRGLCDRWSLAICSMGMSDDLEIAIAEGSTMVRIGSSIFGVRSERR
ncbi:MAG: YggS family pyridoxal phosphate enzyme [Microthrixaceae bacterium]